MATRSVALTEEQGALLERLVAESRCPFFHDALAAALKLLREDEARMDALVERLSLSHQEALDMPPSDGTGEEQVRRVFREAREEWEAKEAVQTRRLDALILPPFDRTLRRLRFGL